MLHKCIKPNCDREYDSDDIEAYYCPNCVIEKDKIAKELDAKMANRPKKEVDNFNSKLAGMRKVGGIPIIN